MTILTMCSSGIKGIQVVLLILIISIFVSEAVLLNSAKLKTCSGHLTCDITRTPDVGERMKKYHEMYNGCQIIENNLILSELPAGANTSFLDQIEEVHGAVVIYQNDIEILSLPRLRLIRGHSLYLYLQNTLQAATAIPRQARSSDGAASQEVDNDLDDVYNTSRNDVDKPVISDETKHENADLKNDHMKCESREELEIANGKPLDYAYSLYVMYNTGLRYLELPALVEILAGHVGFEKNTNPTLSYLNNTVKWTYINSMNSYNRTVFNPPYSGQGPAFECHPSCEVDQAKERSCWGPEPTMCQKVPGLECNCPNGCVEGNVRLCCSEQCASGCTGVTPKDCLACRRVENDGVCMTDCPQIVSSLGAIDNNLGKLAEKNKCVSKCSDGMFEYKEQRCLTKCPTYYEGKPRKDGSDECVRCKNDICPEVEKCGQTGKEVDLDGENIKSIFKHNNRNCKILLGSLKIMETAFNGDNPLTLELLYEYLGELEEVYGYVWMAAPKIISMDFLKKLRRIRGGRLYKNKFALFIGPCEDMEHIGLDSLKKISKGSVGIYKAPKLCYVHGVNFDGILKDGQILGMNKYSRNKSLCEYENKTCSDMCVGGCWGPGSSSCLRCKDYWFNGQCLDYCAINGKLLYESSNGSEHGGKECGECHSECSTGCNGPDNTNCTECKNVKLISTYPYHKIECLEECPAVGFKRNERNECEQCYGEQCKPGLMSGNVPVILAGGFVGVVALIVAVLAACLVTKEKRRKRKKELVTKLIGEEEVEVVDANLSQLRLIKERDLRRGNCIGSGAFGVVYKGVWIPEGEKYKIPVAIKVLNETADSTLYSELLEEAKVMATVCHENCIRIIAACQGASLQLITPLMPAGCLLNYIRENQANVGSRVLISWSTQIARGMEYLEKRSIVHRDLAARNVLVQSSTRVKITDFGLARLLPLGEEQFQSRGEKMPIKWLAPESLLEKVYTHKSDVWSYGVTLWEMYTYGKRPYEQIAVRDMLDALQNGERLEQPEICTIDVYMILVKCWWLNPKARPSFTDLIAEFSRFSEEPSRFLVIKGDKLMRLQSRVQNTADLMRGISGVDHTDINLEVISAEEYLNPAVQAQRPAKGSLGMRGSMGFTGGRVVAVDNPRYEFEPRKPSLLPRPFAENVYTPTNSYENDVRSRQDMTSSRVSDVVLDMTDSLTPPNNNRISERSLQRIREIESLEEDDVFRNDVREENETGHAMIHGMKHSEVQTGIKTDRPVDDKYDEMGYLQPVERHAPVQDRYIDVIEGEGDVLSPLLTGPETRC